MGANNTDVIHRMAETLNSIESKIDREQIGGNIGTLSDSVDNLTGAVSGVSGRLDDVEDAIESVAHRVDNVGNGVVGQFRDQNSYAQLTESISPMQRSSSGGAGGGSSLGQMAALAVQEVLGWKPRVNDSKGFMSALTASFSVKEFEGHTVAKWTPRTYAVQTDLDGGVTGAQASLYTRAKQAVDEGQKLLSGIAKLRLDADPEDMEALRSLISDQMNQVVAELGLLGGPRLQRLDQVFRTLLGPDPKLVEPDEVGGQLGTFRKEFGLAAFVHHQDFVNTVEEEQNLTNFRILTDYMTSLRTSWENDKKFFKRGPGNEHAFFGTRLVLLTRNLTVVGESVDELRFALDSVFIRSAERETLEIKLPDNDRLFLEELMRWMYTFAVEEGPGIVRNGGKYGVRTVFVPELDKLIELGIIAADPANIDNPPEGYRTARVQRSWNELINQLQTLRELAAPITHRIPSHH